jgi:hypothetical protein
MLLKSASQDVCVCNDPGTVEPRPTPGFSHCSLRLCGPFHCVSDLGDSLEAGVGTLVYWWFFKVCEGG